jgi:hypothetical protein
MHDEYNDDDPKSVEAKVTIKRTEFEDGSSLELRIEEVKGGYIISKCKSYKDSNGNWQYDQDKEVSMTNPLEKKMSIADKLKAIIGESDY